MKRKSFFVFLIVLFSALFNPLNALAAGLMESKVVFGGEFTLQKDEVLEGDLVVLGGKATLEEGSLVKGNVALLGGTLLCKGTVKDDVVGFGGEIMLQKTAQVSGDLILFGSAYQQQDGATVLGQVLQYESMRPFAAVSSFHLELPNLDRLSRSWMRWGGFLFRVFAWSALAILCGLLFPSSLERIANVVRNQAIIAGAVGLVSLIVIAIGIFLLALTLILLPLGFLGFVLAALGWILGVLAMGLETGRRLTEAVGQVWSLPITMGVGTFVLVLVVNGVAALVPCVGWIIPFSVGLVGFGAVILTQFGLKDVVL
ncbi:MAG: hypothetical protein Kow0088_03010 [Anaerolineales bacterium]